MSPLGNKFSAIVIALSIHPNWLIEEYVKIFRIDVWIYPPIVLINTDEIIIMNIKNTLKLIKSEIKIKGAIF